VSQLELSAIIRPGDSILWGQATSEPRALTEALVAQRSRLGGVTTILGYQCSDTLRPEHADAIRFVGIGGVGRNAELYRAGVLEVLPFHLSAMPALIRDGRLRVDVVLVQVSPADEFGRHSLGLAADYLRQAMARARVVIGEVNERVPFTLGDTFVARKELDHVVYTSRPPLELSPRPPRPDEREVARQVVEAIPDGAALQFGIGAVPAAVAAGLIGKRELGIHSGQVGDWLVDLVEAGAVTNVRKALDRGVSVAGVLLGTRRLYDFAQANPALLLRSLRYTHDQGVLRTLDRLFAVNSAIEVDLTGQVNAETIDGLHVGTVGGQVDFVRGAIASRRGRSIIALPSTASGKTRSRIVSQLTDHVVTTPRSDADLVITEYGLADLRGVSLDDRAQRLIRIAHPDFRDSLRRQAQARC
jgi:acyl-CoA hydrolase